MKVYAIAATGTGGHVFPALVVANALLARGDKVIWFGKTNGIELNFIKGIEHIPLTVAPVVGKQGKVRRILNLLLVIPKVINKMQEHNVDAFIGFGGYVAVPVGIAAKLIGKNCFIHEQNAIAGRANRLLKLWAKKIFTGFPGVLESSKTIFTGNPIRYNKVWLAPSNVLVLGGSLGAKAINQIMKEVAESSLEVNYRIIAGKANYAALGQLCRNCKNIEIFDFVEDMAAMYSWADAVIARSGALTISEVNSFSLPMLLIPLPSSADNHQLYNAMHAGFGATVVEQFNISSSSVLDWLKNGPKGAVDQIISEI